MADPFNDEDEAPLDPAVERVQQRLRRLMLIAALTLGFGIFAVFAGIVYRLTLDDTSQPAALPKDAATPTISLTELGLPADARIVSSAIDGDRLALTYASGADIMVIVFQMPSMAVVSRLRVTGD